VTGEAPTASAQEEGSGGSEEGSGGSEEGSGGSEEGSDGSIYIYISGKQKYLYLEIATSVCMLQTENGYGKLPFVAANGNVKWKFFFPCSANDKRQSTIAVSAKVPIYVNYMKLL
jgi:hypothetical protein